jgi:glycosyltransferase involved in cell wall biosynthesis
MAERRKVGIIYHYNEGWIGGVYYVQNLIKALGKLPEEKQPEVFAICADLKSFEILQKSTSYHFLFYLPSLPSYSLIQRGINKLSRALFKQNLFDHLRNQVECFFPINGFELNHGISKNIYWIPDFQDQHFPHFFSKDELAAIQNWRMQLSIKKDALLVLSSEAALNDYQHFYPKAVTRNVVIPFAVHNDFSDLPAIENLLVKYALPSVYFMSPNQFWKHKNHSLILDAMRLLKAKGITAHLVFTGKEFDHRNPEYVNELKEFVVNEGLEACVSFLGFIDRNDQLQLMKNAIAIIQPSRFEGWSTVVEDAKSMDQLILASSIPVHKEQLGDAGFYFDTNKPEELVQLMEHVLNNALNRSSFNYGFEQLLFAKNFRQLLDIAI